MKKRADMVLIVSLLIVACILFALCWPTFLHNYAVSGMVWLMGQ